jgi:DNA invertase Pin-like site-specific DNA recombinase
MTTARTATRAALYCRISEDQLGEAEGVDDQRRDGLELCKAKGWTATVFTDNDQTASKKGRGKRRDDFEDMIAAVKRGEFDVIVCRDWARLTRDHLAGAILIDMGDTLRSFIVWYFGLDGEQSW